MCIQGDLMTSDLELIYHVCFEGEMYHLPQRSGKIF